MKKRTIIRAAVLAALSITAIILGVIAFTPQEQDNAFVEIQPLATPEVIHIGLAGATAIPIAPTVPPSPSPTSEVTPVPTPHPQKEGDAFFTLNILGNDVAVAYGVEEATLKKSPGWLTTSVLPGENGMCVVYGHRNRNHFKVLQNAEVDDSIKVTMADGTTYTYSIIEIKIYESTSDWTLPVMDGKTLVLVTCYPFRYSGHAPGKCVVTAVDNS